MANFEGTWEFRAELRGNVATFVGIGYPTVVLFHGNALSAQAAKYWIIMSQ